MEVKREGEEKKNRPSHLWEKILGRPMVMVVKRRTALNSEKSWIVVIRFNLVIPINDTACSNQLLANTVSPPFFYFGNGYLDNDYGQTLFLDVNLVDIMVDKGTPPEKK